MEHDSCLLTDEIVLKYYDYGSVVCQGHEKLFLYQEKQWL